MSSKQLYYTNSSKVSKLDQLPKLLQSQHIKRPLQISNSSYNITDKNFNNQNQQQQDFDQINKINLRELRLKNRQAEHTIKSIQTKIIYMKNKQQKTVKRVLNIKRKLSSIDNIRSKTKQLKNKYLEEKKKDQQQRVKRTEYNKLIKDHLKYNKKIVTTLMNHKITQQAKSFKQKNNKLEVLAHIQQENLIQQNIQKANQVRMQHIQAHERRKLYFLDKLHQFKQFKEDKLKQQLKQKQRQQQMISQLQRKQKMLLDKLSASQKFRIKCQQEYEQAKNKYKSFFQATRNLSRGHRSCDQSRIFEDSEGKADIFIS